MEEAVTPRRPNLAGAFDLTPEKVYYPGCMTQMRKECFAENQDKSKEDRKSEWKRQREQLLANLSKSERKRRRFDK